MAQINSCLKRVFIGFNLLFAILGGVLIGLAMLSQAFTDNEERSVSMETRTTGLIFLYVIGACTMLIALLGAYGAYREHKVSLIVFLVLMIVGALLMFRAGISTAIVRPQLEDILEEKIRSHLPLNTASPDVQHLADKLQMQLHCCGLFSYSDWNNRFPESCLCLQGEEKDMCTIVEYRRTLFLGFNSESQLVYSKPCFPIIRYYILRGADILVGFFFTLASLAVLGMILSSIMIYQLRHRNRPAVLLSVPTIFTPSLPKYQELQNPPPKYEEVQNPPPKYQELQNSPPPSTPVY